ncbi:MAG: P-II family nitrogen regulator [Dictyoglomus sp.]|jgi:nitrogen regulatory protein P-II 1|uniref:P-II family nitrogen regulator n=1 Tax=Dictyoglomus sp. TaxID=28205 RepID=UPI003CB784D8
MENMERRKYRIELLPKIKIEIVVKYSDIEVIIKAIIESAKTKEVGDGKIFVLDIKEAIRIRTGERRE